MTFKWAEFKLSCTEAAGSERPRLCFPGLKLGKDDETFTRVHVSRILSKELKQCPHLEQFPSKPWVYGGFFCLCGSHPEQKTLREFQGATCPVPELCPPIMRQVEFAFDNVVYIACRQLTPPIATSVAVSCFAIFRGADMANETTRFEHPAKLAGMDIIS